MHWGISKKEEKCIALSVSLLLFFEIVYIYDIMYVPHDPWWGLKNPLSIVEDGTQETFPGLGLPRW